MLHEAPAPSCQCIIVCVMYACVCVRAPSHRMQISSVKRYKQAQLLAMPHVVGNNLHGYVLGLVVVLVCYIQKFAFHDMNASGEIFLM